MRRNIHKGLLMMLAGMVAVTQAADRIWDGGGTGNDWSVASNWSDDTSPGASDNAYIGQGNGGGLNPATVDYTTGSTSVANLRAGWANGGNGTLNINGGSLSASTLYMAMYNDSVGEINVDGGTLTLGLANHFLGDSSSGSAEINLISGSVNAQHNFWMGNNGGSSSINISGGVWDGGGLKMDVGGNAALSVDGDAATIGFEHILSGGSGTSTFNLTADASGISTVGTDFNISLAGTDTLNIDVSNYDFATHGDSLVLFDAGGVLSGTFDNVNITGGGNLVYTGDQVVLESIPEPATIGLVTGFGTVVLFVRRIFII